MSILDRLKKQESPDNKKLFGVLLGTRTSGKTTTVATLSGRTLLLQAAVLESGSDSAVALAKELGNDLSVLTFESATELAQILKELLTDENFDNVAIDSLSAITELIYRTPEVARMTTKNVWDGFRLIGDKSSEIIMQAKALTYASMTTKPKHVWMLCAIDASHDAQGNINEVKLISKGNMAVSVVSKLGEAVITVLPPVPGDDGQPRRLITKSQGFFPGRVDGLLDHNNPGIIAPASLDAVIKLRK